MLESVFQSNLVRELKDRFVGCYVLKNDANYIQGFPDLLILYRNRWAVLECKAFCGARLQPNQSYHLEKLDEMSFGALIYPENKEDVLQELTAFFEA